MEWSRFAEVSRRWDCQGGPISKSTLGKCDRLLKAETPDKGINVIRVKHNEREMAFAECWAEECEPKRWLNQGQGLVQNLFFKAEDRWPFRNVMRMWLSKRERMIAATCIQWLGSNCGWAFLNEALKKCGYRIVKIKDTK